MSGKVRESPMSDIAYLRKLAERYRKLARSFKHAAIRDRLETLADDLEQKVRAATAVYLPALRPSSFATVAICSACCLSVFASSSGPPVLIA